MLNILEEKLKINPILSDNADDALKQSVLSAISNKNISRTGQPTSLSLHEKEGSCYYEV